MLEIQKGSDIRLAFQMGYAVQTSKTTGRLYAVKKSWWSRFKELFEV